MKKRTIPIIVILTILAGISLIPLYIMVVLSNKESGEVVHHLWRLPKQLRFDFYQKAFIYLQHYIVNSMSIASIVVLGVLVLSVISGYVFARLTFPGKNILFLFVISFMFIPGILTLIPAYLWMKEFPLMGGNNFWGEGGSGVLNTWWVMILPGISAGQIFGIYLFRSFFESLPKDIFEAARIDGASEIGIMFRIALPLCLPTVATLAILQFLGIYNDYIWPLVTISDSAKQLFSVGVTRFNSEGNLELGPTMAGYVIGAIPLIVIFTFGMKYYVTGLMKGALKA